MMIKKLAIVAAVMSLGCGAMAQEGGSSSSLGTNNKIQVSLLLGNQMMFDQSTDYLLPNYSKDGTYGNPGSMGVSPEIKLNFNELGQNNLVNIAGVQFAYYPTDNIDVNVMFGMDIRKTPKKDLIEGVAGTHLSVPTQMEIDGRLTNNWIGNLGINYHFATSNDKVDLYLGAQGGYQQGRITADYAYDGSTYIYRPNMDKGQVHCITGAAIAGVSYSFVPGFSLGFETAPIAYQYSLLELIPTGLGVYQCDHHAYRIFASPMLKLGIRF